MHILLLLSCNRMAARARDVLEAKEYVALVREHVSSWSMAYKASTLEHVVESYELFIQALIAQTPRASSKSLKVAAIQVHGRALQDATLFASSLVNAFGSIRKKSSVITTGKRQSHAMMRCIALYRQHHCKGMVGLEAEVEVVGAASSSSSGGSSMSSGSSSSSSASGLTWSMFNNRFGSPGNDEDPPPARPQLPAPTSEPVAKEVSLLVIFASTSGRMHALPAQQCIICTLHVYVSVTMFSSTSVFTCMHAIRSACTLMYISRCLSQMRSRLLCPRSYPP